MIKVIYKPPAEMTEDMERGLERAFSLLFEKTLQNYKKQKTSAGSNLVGAEASEKINSII